MVDIVYLDELTFQEVEQLDKEKSFILLPMGPVESHGPHLPLGVDIRGAEIACKMAAEKLMEKGLQPIMAPTMPYTLAEAAMPFAGTVTLSRKTLKSFIHDLAKSFAQHGFKNFVIFCHHGELPNFNAISEAAEESKEYGIRVLNSKAIFKGMDENINLIQGEHPELDAHAGESETALYLWKFPHLVKQNIVKDLPDNWSPLRKNLSEGANDFMEAGGPLSYFGSPSKATAKTGQLAYEVISNLLTKEVEHFLSTT